tara:strand:+ start:3467 stop:4384 length:918 start_codon:yes stop_codon:yes gene_type:complete
MIHSQSPFLITILGPTASGKTKLAVELAKQLTGEIISADSRQVYKHMDIGTGKDLNEYGHIPYHLIDIVNPNAEYNLFNFAVDFNHAFNAITQRHHLPFLVGGTGMYLDAVLSRYKLTIANIDEKTRLKLEKKSESELTAILCELKPTLHNTTDIQNKDRLLQAIEIAMSENENARLVTWPSFKPLILGIKIERTTLKNNITTRLKERLQAGMIEEVSALRQQGITDQRIDNFGLEYRYLLKHLKGELNYNDMFQKLNAAIVNFTKQQHKWFRNLEKKGHKIVWLDSDTTMSEAALIHINSATRF